MTRKLILRALAVIVAVAVLGVSAHFLIRAIIAAHTG